MWVGQFIISLQENKMRLAHLFLRASHKISGSLSVIRVTYFTFGTPYYIKRRLSSVSLGTQI